MRRYQNAAYAIALSHLRRKVDAEDVVQEAFVVAWCKLGQLRDASSFGGWFRRIVAAESLHWLRRRRREGMTASLEVVAELLSTDAGSPVGRVDATVYVPAGVTLTVFNAEAVNIQDVEANLFLINSHGCSIEGVRGRVYLLNTPIERAANLTGSLYQCYHSYGGVSSAGERARRSTEFRSALENIAGDIEIDVGRVRVEATGLSGDIRIRNRYGDTRVGIEEFAAGSRFQITSTSGEVHIALAKDLLDELALTALTICVI